jgi:hypothetical protein
MADAEFGARAGANAGPAGVPEDERAPVPREETVVWDSLPQDGTGVATVQVGSRPLPSVAYLACDVAIGLTMALVGTLILSGIIPSKTDVHPLVDEIGFLSSGVVGLGVFVGFGWTWPPMLEISASRLRLRAAGGAGDVAEWRVLSPVRSVEAEDGLRVIGPDGEVLLDWKPSSRRAREVREALARYGWIPALTGPHADLSPGPGRGPLTRPSAHPAALDAPTPRPGPQVDCESR